jgi:hypothetical protein
MIRALCAAYFFLMLKKRSNYVAFVRSNERKSFLCHVESKTNMINEVIFDELFFMHCAMPFEK